jgi:hypothetical protein
MTEFLYWAALAVVPSVIFASFFEWTLHRFVMHKPLGKFTYPFRTHTLVHHQIFRADHTYHLIEEKDKWTIPMAWWNGPVLVFLTSLPFTIVGWWLGKWGFVVGGLVTHAAYYGTYEYMHWCMHLPRKRFVERSGLFFRLNGHHILHHRYMHKNFNVVFPLADLCLGTLLLRSKIRFPQPQGPSVPDLQPVDHPKPLFRRILGFIRICLTGVKSH